MRQRQRSRARTTRFSLWTAPPSVGSESLEIEYNRSGDDSTATDISYISEVYRFRICDRALQLLYMSLGDYEKASIYGAEWERDVIVGKRSDNKKKWANFGGQALMWQQDYTARYNQQ